MRFLPALLLSFLGASTGIWLLFVLLARLTGAEITPWNPNGGGVSEDRLFDITRATATVAGVLGAVFAILYAYRKQRVEESDSRRKDSELLSKRFQEAANQLGHERPPVRLAGVYAMSKLADDWPEQRQECVDVLCAYLRLPSPDGASAEETESDGVVRRAIFDQIRLKTDRDLPGRQSWSDLRLDLSGIVARNLDFFYCRFENLILDRAEISESVSFHMCEVSGFVSASDLTVSGTLNLGLSGTGRVNLWKLSIKNGGRVYLGQETPAEVPFNQPKLTISYAKVDEGGSLRISVGSGAPRGHVALRGSVINGELAVYGRGYRPIPGAINISDVTTKGDGEIGFQKELLDNPDIIKPRPTSSPELKVMTFMVTDWEVVETD